MAWQREGNKQKLICPHTRVKVKIPVCISKPLSVKALHNDVCIEPAQSLSVADEPAPQKYSKLENPLGMKRHKLPTKNVG